MKKEMPNYDVGHGKIINKGLDGCLEELMNLFFVLLITFLIKK